jgi:hypothetical protein
LNISRGVILQGLPDATIVFPINLPIENINALLANTTGPARYDCGWMRSL